MNNTVKLLKKIEDLKFERSEIEGHLTRLKIKLNATKNAYNRNVSLEDELEDQIFKVQLNLGKLNLAINTLENHYLESLSPRKNMVNSSTRRSSPKRSSPKRSTRKTFQV